MFKYQSLSRVTKSFYGVEFEPGSIHDVPGYINDKRFRRLSEEEAKKLGAPKQATKSKSAESTASDSKRSPKKEVETETTTNKKEDNVNG